MYYSMRQIRCHGCKSIWPTFTKGKSLYFIYPKTKVISLSDGDFTMKGGFKKWRYRNRLRFTDFPVIKSSNVEGKFNFTVRWKED